MTRFIALLWLALACSAQAIPTRDLSGPRGGAGGVGGLLAMTVHTGPQAGSYIYFYDGNGNVAGLLDAATGAVAARYEYGPFGELLRATGPLAFVNPRRFFF